MTTVTFDNTPMDLDIYRARGDTFPFILTVVDSDGTAIDITSATFLLTVDLLENPTDASQKLFQVVGAIVVAASGTVKFTLTEPNSDQTPLTYYYDIQMTDAASKVRTIAKGSWVVSQDITKDT